MFRPLKSYFKYAWVMVLFGCCFSVLSTCALADPCDVISRNRQTMLQLKHEIEVQQAIYVDALSREGRERFWAKVSKVGLFSGIPATAGGIIWRSGAEVSPLLKNGTVLTASVFVAALIASLVRTPEGEHQDLFMGLFIANWRPVGELRVWRTNFWSSEAVCWPACGIGWKDEARDLRNF